MTFKDFNFHSSLQEGLQAMGFSAPTPIQQQAVPVVLEHKDLIACAQTGTGKTAAYLLPVIHDMLQVSDRHLHTLILAPTRELAQQIDQQIEGLAYFTGVSSMAVYGGGDGITYEQQRRALKEGADIIIATPGRLISHLTSGIVRFDHLQHLILDEADRMLDMGFYEDILRIVSYLPEDRQTLLFSATMPPRIRTLAKRILKKPEEISLAVSMPAEKINQQAYSAYDQQKLPLLRDLLKQQDFTSILIFASTKEKVKQLHSVFRRERIPAEAFHSDLEQQEREKILLAFKNRQLKVIIGTDVLSRGIDVEDICLVINFDVPPDPEDYVHRIGRTARASRTGTAITFINEKDQRRFAGIEQLIGKEIPKIPLPESLGPGPLYRPGSSRGSGAGRERSRRRKPFHKKNGRNQRPGNQDRNKPRRT